jgi:hypothetical protein
MVYMIKNKSRALGIILFSLLIINFFFYILEFFQRQETGETSAIFEIYSNIFSILIFIPAIWFTFQAYHEYGIKNPTGKVWFFMGLGFLFWNIGDFIWMIYEVGGQDPFPSVADVAYLLGYPLIYIAIQMQVKEVKTPLKTVEIILIGTIVIITVAIFVFFNIIPVWETYQAGEETLLGTIVGLAYPVLDIYLTPLALLLYLKFRGGQFARAWLYFALGFLIVIIADILFSIFSYSEDFYLICDQLYALSYVIFAVSVYSILQTLRLKV